MTRHQRAQVVDYTLTSKQRARIVELLRCTADRNYPLDTYGLHPAAHDLGIGPGLRCQASLAIIECVGSRGEDWRHACLEAAQRVEDKEWP